MIQSNYSNDPTDLFSVACYCKEGGAPHEDMTGTCKHLTEYEQFIARQRLLPIEAPTDEAPGCAGCETDTDEAVEECPDCSEHFHPSCIEDHECEEET